MFKAILLGQWHSLSDVRIDFIIFTGFELNDDVPDSTTLCKFRNILIHKGLDKNLKDLENENARLKKVVAELTLDKLILNEALSGK